jgi:DNA polymerase-3 subunit delta'
MKVVVHEQAQAQLDGVRPARASSFIFHGVPSVGKSRAALELARKLNCLGDDQGTCSACKQFEAGAFPDIVTLKPEDKPSITIEQVRALTHTLSLSLYYAHGTRVVVIDEANALTIEAQNALLKLIEEPPPSTMFILITSHLEALVPTIRSRCAQIYFPKLATEQVAAFLEREHNLKPVQAGELALASGGVVGTAVMLATEPDQAKARLELISLADQVQQVSTFERLVIAKRLAESKADLADFARVLHVALVNRLKSDSSAQGLVSHQLQALERFRCAIQAKVVPRVAVEQLVLEL